MVPGSRNAFLLLLGLILTTGCASRDQRFAGMAEEFVFSTLAFSPVGATGAGLHEYQGQDLDSAVDDLSPAGIDRQTQFYHRFRDRLHGLSPERLGAEEAVDYRIIDDQISLALLDLERIHSFLHNPTIYVELVGNALFTPYVLEYAPKPQRFKKIIARLQKLPVFLDAAKVNLTSSPDIWTRVAAEENQGNLDLIDRVLRNAAPQDQRSAYDAAAKPALDALNAFQAYLEKKLSLRNNYSFRLGRELYVQKFRYVMQAGIDAATVLQQAELELPQVQKQMYELALPLHRRDFPSHPDHGEAGRMTVIREVLDKIAETHATPREYIPQARTDLAEAREFVKAKHVLTLPEHSNLQVIETPEFMRGIYAVGGFNPAPPLEPRMGAFYWVTPIPSTWPKERIESKLREYNFYKLKLLTIHEAMPGHYVQAEFANQVEPRYRRLLRAIYGNTPYVEGWAQYITETLLDQGFLDNSPEMRLTFLKEELRVLANAILDIRIQMLDMKDQDALDLMEKQTFQESEEATAKLQRAKLSSTQLPSYWVGWQGWRNVRSRVRAARGTAFDLSRFHDDALKQGAVPLPALEELLLEPAGSKSN